MGVGHPAGALCATASPWWAWADEFCFSLGERQTLQTDSSLSTEVVVAKKAILLCSQVTARGAAVVASRLTMRVRGS